MAKHRTIATFGSLKDLRTHTAAQDRAAAIVARYGRANPQGWGLDAATTEHNPGPPVAAAGSIEQRSTGTMQGTIKKIDSAKAFGFIRGENGTDYFFHKSAVARDVEFHELREGERVSFEASEGPKGPRAEDIERA